MSLERRKPCSKRPLWRGLQGLLALASLCMGLGLAKADPMVPTLIIDAKTGEVLQEEAATRPWFPASTTKLMTAYVALRAVQAGEISFETPLVASALAAKQPPSKVGMRPGQEITLENALKILMVKSANDIAYVIAEGVGGSVQGFSGMMNREAQRLGMRESHFVNPNGLHAEDQVTSARDMAILARALLLEFPDYEGLWSIGAVRLGTRVYQNTNGLIGRYSGAMGMKTGFVCTSGFNLVSAAQRDGRTLIAVVFGAATAADRTLKAAQLLDQGFGAGGGFWVRKSGVTLANLPQSVEGSAPNRREEICRRGRRPASDEDDMSGAQAAASAAVDRPSMLVAQVPGVGEAAAVGLRVGPHVALGPRASFEPLPVYLGRKPGSTALARRPLSMPERVQSAQAFAPQRNAKANAALPGAITNLAAPAKKATPLRPGAQASLHQRAKTSPAKAAPKAIAAASADQKTPKKLPPAPARATDVKATDGRE